MSFLKKVLSKLGKSDVAKKVDNTASAAKNYGRTASGTKAPKELQKLLSEGDSSTFKDHPFASKDATKKFHDAKGKVFSHQVKEKMVKIGIPAAGGAALGFTLSPIGLTGLKRKVSEKEET